MKKLFPLFAAVLLFLPLASANSEIRHLHIAEKTGKIPMSGKIPETNISISAASSLPSQIATTSQISGCVQITQPGYYILTRNISALGSTCIHIASSDVVIDGSGYAIVGNGWSGFALGFNEKRVLQRLAEM